jgi:pSer/pThr/pTyr-binding forkhead associated (FHA) protein
MRTLSVTTGPAAGRTLELESEVVIGREGADLTIADAELSRRHAAVRPVERGVTVEDLDSLNGTFVNGKRITGPVTLTTGGTIRLGTTEIAVELTLPDVTRPAAIPVADDRTRATPVPPPPDVTAARPAPPQPPDATTARPVPPPDLTAARPSAGPGPDVTAARAAPPPDVTAARPAPPPAGPPPPAAQAPAGPPPPGAPSRRPPAPLLVLAGALVVVAVVLIVLLAGGDSTKKRTLAGTMNVGTVQLQGKRMLFAGLQTGRPAGEGSVTFDQTSRTPARIARQVKGPVTAVITSSFDNGSITSRLDATVRQEAGGTARYDGRARILRGTADFKGATGSYRLTGVVARSTAQVSRADEDNGTFQVRGSVKY